MKTLLIVDMQEGFMTKPNYIELKTKINELISKNEYDKYIFTKFVNKEQSLYQKELKWFDLNDEKSQEICVTIPKNSLIFEKYGYGLSFENIEKIKQLNISQIDLCGIELDACVYAIALQMWDNNIFPSVLINYVGIPSGIEKSTKNIIIRQFGKFNELP